MAEHHTPKYIAHKEFLSTLFTTACEGGMNYWAVFEYYRWQSVERDGSLALPERPERVNEDGSSQCTAKVADKEDDWLWDHATQKERDNGEVEEPVWYEMTTDTMRLGIERMMEAGEFKLQYTPLMGWYQPRKALYDAIVTNGDEGDYDSIDADMIAQWGLFGKVIYG